MRLNDGVARNALVIVAVLMSAYGLYWLRAILTPLALALFLLIMVDGLARTIGKALPIAGWAALPLALLVSTVALGLTVWLVVDNAAGFATELAAAAPKLNEAIARLAGLFNVRVPPTVQSLIDQLNPSQYIGDVARALQSFASGAGAVLLYLGFLIASRTGFRRKVNALFPDSDDLAHASAVFIRIRDAVERYLWVQTVTGAVIAIASGVVMAALGLQNAVFWAFLIFVFCYIPVIGGLISGVLPPLFALLQFDTYWQAIALFAALQIILFAVGSILLPRMQQDSLNIDPVVVLLSLALWGAIWGISGMFLSTPLTVMGILILAQFQGSRWIAVLLSGDGEPETEPVLPRPAHAAPSPRPDA